MAVETITWVGGVDGYARMVDQRRLPTAFEQIDCHDVEEMFDAIRTLAVRGAPALGIAAAYGVLLGAGEIKATDTAGFLAELGKVTKRLGESRPTAVNLFWGLRRMEEAARRASGGGYQVMREALLAEARAIREEDMGTCRRIGRNGAALIAEGDSVLTHCNAGGLATGGYGTALGVLFAAQEDGKRFEVYADETRPLLQGARLTTWELMEAGIRVTLICDSMSGMVMRAGRVNKVIVGADRIAANGDVANKVGTYGLAQLARAHGIPFYVAAPVSTFDLSLKSGKEIPIEERDGDEVAAPFGTRVAPTGVAVYNPAFDVTPAELVSAIVTELGVIEGPDEEEVRAHLGGK